MFRLRGARMCKNMMYVITLDTIRLPNLLPLHTHSHRRVRQAEKKKKKIHIKRPGAKKDEKKRVLLALKEHMQVESTDGMESSDSESELGRGGIPESPLTRIKTPTMNN